MEDEIDLIWNRANRHRFRECVFPEVAVKAAPRAFAVCKKDRCHGNDLAGRGSLLLDDRGKGLVWVEMIAGSAFPQNPFAAGLWRRWIG